MTPDKYNPPIGLVGALNSKGLSAFLQHTFAGPGVSHSFLITYPIGMRTSTPMAFEADMRVVHTPWKTLVDDPDYSIWLYRIKDLTPYEMTFSLDKCTAEFSGVVYGYFEWLWFLWRWFNEKILRRDVRHEDNWFTKGVICSELWWWYVWYITDTNVLKWGKLRAILDQWNPDTIQPYDIKKIMDANPDIFEPYVAYIGKAR